MVKKNHGDCYHQPPPDCYDDDDLKSDDDDDDDENKWTSLFLISLSKGRERY